MDWTKLYCGHISRQEVQRYVVEPDWQKVRIMMKGTSLEFKYRTLLEWLTTKKPERAAQVQVTNYVTALSRGGLIKPEDYLKKEDV